MRAGLAIAALFFAGFAAFMFVSAIALQTGAHLSPLGSGMALAPLALAFFAASLFTAALTERYGRSVVAAGALDPERRPGRGGGDAALGLAARRRPGARTRRWSIAGVGQGLVVSPLFGFVLAGVPAHRAGVGSGILTTTMQSALALGVATLGSLFLSLDAPGSLGMRSAFVP